MKTSVLSLLFFLAVSINCYSQIDHWETAIYADDTWNYFVGTSEPPTDWNTVDFDDSNWLQGPGSIGYGDGDDNTEIPKTESLYMRRKFNIIDLSVIESLLFHADFDDGFVAYINGVEIARTNMDGDPPAFNSWATALREATMYAGGTPVKYDLPDQFIDDHLVDGENVLAIQTHNFEGTVSSDLTTLYWLSLGITDASANYGPTPPWLIFISNNFESNLPIITIDTQGQPIPDEPKIQGELGIIWNADGLSNQSGATPNEYLGKIEIEKRGQSSLWAFPKNGYGFETKDANWQDLDTAFLNFPAEEDWILHGPYSDKTLIRNVLAMEIANRMGQYASRTRLVELVVNGSYEGVYVMMEKIKRDKNRVDIAKLNPEDIAGDELTGGYVIKLDKGTPDWLSQYDIANSPGNKLRYQYVSPNRDKILPAQANYIQSFMYDFEIAMNFPDSPYKDKYYFQYMDLESFADHFIISEITRNVDGYRLSTYLHKDKDSNGGLLKAGPIWDYNLGFGNADYCFGAGTTGWIYDEHCDLGNPFWWENLFQEERFWNTVKCRWDDFRSGSLSTESILAYIDTKTALLDEAKDRNFARWPVLNDYVWPNPVVTGSYEGEIEYLKQFLIARLNWMDQNIVGECVLVTSLHDDIEKGKLEVYPNPSTHGINIKMSGISATDLQVFLIDLNGKQSRLNYNVSINDEVEIHYGQLIRPGIYFLEILDGSNIIGREKIIIEQ